MSPTLSDLEQEFYATQLGLGQPWPSISDLRTLFYMGVKNGNISLGGGAALNLETVPAGYQHTISHNAASAMGARPTTRTDVYILIVGGDATPASFESWMLPGIDRRLIVVT